MQQPQQTHLITLQYSKQNKTVESFKQPLSDFPKFFFANKINATIIYDRNVLHFLHKNNKKSVDLGKTYLIAQLSYHHQRELIAFSTIEGILYIHIIASKTQFIVRKDLKKQMFFTWVFSLPTYAQFMVSDENGIKLFKIQQQKKSIKQVKSINGKYNQYLYEPQAQMLIAFPYGDCKTIHTYHFIDQKIKTNFKGPIVPFDFSYDQSLMARAHIKKNLGIEGSKVGKDVFYRVQQNQYYATVVRMNMKSYIIFYFGTQGKLKFLPVGQQLKQQLMIKLPSDSMPTFNVLDNMLLVHLKSEKITFIYDVKGSQIQALVSPFTVAHNQLLQRNMYMGQFIGKRHILPSGSISKWKINLPIIHFYLKNENQIFEFYLRRKKAKMNLLTWLRENLFQLKHLNLSKFWKQIFNKSVSNLYHERDVISLIDLYANVFYTLSTEDFSDKEELLSIMTQCIRQAIQFQIKIPLQIQKLLTDLLIMCKKYDNLVFLVHNDIIKDSQQLAAFIFHKGIERQELILQTLGLDMMNRVSNPHSTLKILAKSQQIRQMKRYIKANYENIQMLHLIYVAKYLTCKLVQQQYLKFTKMFIFHKFPSTNPTYIQEAENIIRSG